MYSETLTIVVKIMLDRSECFTPPNFKCIFRLNCLSTRLSGHSFEINRKVLYNFNSFSGIQLFLNSRKEVNSKMIESFSFRSNLPFLCDITKLSDLVKSVLYFRFKPEPSRSRGVSRPYCARWNLLFHGNFHLNFSPNYCSFRLNYGKLFRRKLMVVTVCPFNFFGFVRF